MSQLVPKVLNLAYRNGFILSSEVIAGNVKFGPSGQLLRNNISHEWFYSNVVEVDNVFPIGQEYNKIQNWSGIKEAFDYAKNLNGSKLPFGLAEIRPGYSPEPTVEYSEEQGIFFPKKATLMRTCKFERPAQANHAFDYWQRQRKIWWRKFANCPGWFSLSDIRNGPQGQEVDIVATMPSGPIVVETLRQLGSQPFEQLEQPERSIFEVKDGRRLVLPHIVESVTTLETATLVYLCDAFEEKSAMEQTREVLCFHRKLAPYKVAFTAAPSVGTVAQDITELAGFLARVLRRAGLSTLLLPDFGKKSLESQNTRNDELGIPYCVVLNETALKNGIIGLRNRDTTIKEQVHVAELKKYIKTLFRNY